MSQKVNRNLGLQRNFLKLLKTFSAKKAIVLPLEHLHKGEILRKKPWLERGVSLWQVLLRQHSLSSQIL